MTQPIGFGKYRNRTIEDVYKIDIGYARWLMNQEQLIGNRPDIKEYLKSKFDDSDGSFLMTWGRYKGRTIKWIHDQDASYIRWLQSHPYVADNIPKLKHEIDQLS